MLFHVIDVETTGDQPEDEIIEIGIVECFDGEEIRRPYTKMFYPPTRDISISAMSIHHITKPTLAGLPSFASWWADEAVQPELTARVAHNSQFEATYIPADNIPWICTYKCAMRLWPDAEKFSNQYLRYWLKLDIIPEMLTYVNKVHRAGPDAYVTALLFQRMLQEVSWEQLVQWTLDIARYPRLNFGMHSGQKWVEVPWSYLDWIVRKSSLDTDTIQLASEELQRRRML